MMFSIRFISPASRSISCMILQIWLLSCQAPTDDQSPKIVAATLTAQNGAGPFRITVQTENVQPEVTRTLNCGSEPFAVNYDTQLLFKKDNSDQWYVLILDSNDMSFAEQQFSGVVKPEDEDQITLGQDSTYDVQLILPSGDSISREIELFGHLADDTESDTSSDSQTDSSADTESDTPPDTETETASEADSATDTVEDTASDSATTGDSSSDTGLDTAVDTATGVDTDSLSDTDTHTETADTDSLPTLHIEAECAIGTNRGDCNGTYSGAKSTTLWDNSAQDWVPICVDTCQTVEYMNSSAWVAYDEIDLTGYRYISLRVASANPIGNLRVTVDNLFGFSIATATTSTDSWTEYGVITVPLYPTAGIHTLYIIGGANNDGGGNANIDWIELSQELPEEKPDVLDPTQCSDLGDCYGGCWDCAAELFCVDANAACAANNACAAIQNCMTISCPTRPQGAWTPCMEGCIRQNPTGEDAWLDLENCVICDVCHPNCEGQVTCLP